MCAAAAQMAELVDALVSGTSGESRGGSSPLLGTKHPSEDVRWRSEPSEKTSETWATRPVGAGVARWHPMNLLVFLLVLSALIGTDRDGYQHVPFRCDCSECQARRDAT